MQQQQYPKRQAQLYFFLFLLLLLPQIAVCVFSHKSLTPETQELLLSNRTMSTASHHHHHHHHHSLRQRFQMPCAVVKEENPTDSDSDASPTASARRKEFHLSADCCDCGMLTGCRCSDPICDMMCPRVDESEMEEGMDDQGYRQHV